MDPEATVPATYDQVIIPGSGVHSPEERPAKAATCTEWGNEHYYKCTVCKAAFEDADCTKSVFEGRKMIAPRHDLKLVSGEAATCTESGIKEHYECASCGKMFDMDKTTELAAADIGLASTGHDWNIESSVEATCTKDGKTVMKCSKCGETKTEVIKAAHDWKDDPAAPSMPATCTADGKVSQKCAKCGETRTETIPALGHKYAAKCDDMWNHTLTCERDGCEYEVTEPHNYGQWHKIDKESDDKTATWHRDCKDCGWYESWTQDLAESPRTGDENNVVIYSLICVMTLGAAGAAAILLRKKENG